MDPTVVVCPQCGRQGRADSVCEVCGRHGRRCHARQDHVFWCAAFTRVRQLMQEEEVQRDGGACGISAAGA